MSYDSSQPVGTDAGAAKAPKLPFVRKWGILVVLSLALAIIILDTTILNVALSTIIQDLHTSIQSLQWVITAYSLTLAALTITGGRMGDIFGRKRMFVLGAFLFAVGSFVASISTTVPMLITGESIIEGIGAALMMPATASLLVSNFFGRERAIAFGVWGGIAGASVALGPVLGGFLATNYSWRWGFRVNLIVVGLLILGSVLIPSGRGEKKKLSLDLVGVVLSAVGMLSLVFGIIESSRYGWFTAAEEFSAFGHAISLPANMSIVPVFMAVGTLVLILFMLWERFREARGKTPLVSTHLFENRMFTSGVFTTAIMSLGQTGLIFALPVFLQSVRGLDAYHTGLTLLPMSLGLLIISPLSAVIGKWVAPKYLINFGLLLNALGYLILWHTLSVDTTSADLIFGLTVYGTGMGFVMSQINNITLSAVEVHQAGEASGVNNTLRQVGSTLGSAIMGAILIGALGTQLAQGVKDSRVIPNDVKPELARVVETQTSNVEFGGGAQLDSSLPDNLKAEVIGIGHQATVDAAKRTLTYGAFFAFLGLLVSIIFLPATKVSHAVAPTKQETEPETPEAAAVRKLWDLGVGRELGFESLADYQASCPVLHEGLKTDDPNFPLLVLVDGRISADRLANLLGVRVQGEILDGSNSYWVRCQAGERYRGQSIDAALMHLAPGEQPLSAFEGLMVMAQYPQVSAAGYLDLPATAYPGQPLSSACLGAWAGSQEIRWRWRNLPEPSCGVASRR